MNSYYVILTCRNSEDTIGKTLDSIFNQVIKPVYIIVINDGSTDSTLNILENYKNIHQNLYIISNPDAGYDVTRIVKNWNKAIKFAKDNKLEITEYHMISADDTAYSETYAKRIMNLLNSDPKLMAASGDDRNSSNMFPRGTGRFIRNKLFAKTVWKGYYPERMGYESAILYEGERLGFSYLISRNVKFDHLRPIGSIHKFYEWGASMKTLGYHPVYVIGRFLKNLLTGKETGRIGAVRMLYSYLKYNPTKSGYNSLYEKELQEYVRNKQLNIVNSFKFLNI
ncbi:MAG: glycosyltransferase family 2 protein [Nitrososphaeraceae archaeon]|nr:glycosyltransferase family 2 protein [Nitrososphaeraceae archaeon]